NTYGEIFRISSFGESHGPAVGVVVDGVPGGIEISESEINQELARRRPGQSHLVSQRKEPDECEILSGIFEGLTIGTPIAIVVRNTNARPEDYKGMLEIYRPSHADFTYEKKYGVKPQSGGGRSSARETIARVAAGVIAQKVLDQFGKIEIVAYVKKVHDITAQVDSGSVTRADVDSNPVRCPDPDAAQKMEEKIDAIRKDGDSLGGIVECVVRGAHVGWGEPVFDKIDGCLAQAMLSLPACKGFEIGSGFAGTDLKGSEHNDPFVLKDGEIATSKNDSGGVQGGITNGQNIIFRAAFKPTATIMKDQASVNRSGEETVLKSKGRHDPCVLPRAVPIVEAMTAITLADHALRQRTRIDG
ncbi:MAG: chorismate synthase, partial [Candidatus Lindowbacteria bacterium]|nr:chorismate synthase [Candidatus Lindowbacteria bacterium]